MVPPWSLLSPTGVLYYVRNEDDLRKLAREEDLVVGSKKNNLLRELVDPANKKRLDQLPRHRAHWQLLQRVQWLQCVETAECVPVVGGDGDYFVKNFACAREDMQAFDGSRLNQLLNKGWLWRNGEKSNIYTQKSDSSLRWKRLDEPPADASSLLPSVPLPSPYATPPTEPPTEPLTEPLAAPPTETPTATPTKTPTEQPTATPTATPTEQPTMQPTMQPTEQPTEQPTVPPTVPPTVLPTAPPTAPPMVELTSARPSAFAFDPNRTALLMIDWQRDFLEEGGFGHLLGNDVGLLRTALAPAAAVLHAARRASLLVVHTVESHDGELNDCPLAKRRRCPAIGTMMEPSRGRVLVRGEPGNAIVGEVEPLETELIVYKPGKGAFFATGLQAMHAESIAPQPLHPPSLRSAPRPAPPPRSTSQVRALAWALCLSVPRRRSSIAATCLT